MPIVKSVLNGGVAEVDEATAKVLVESGHWLAEGDAPAAPRKRAPRKAATAASEE